MKRYTVYEEDCPSELLYAYSAEQAARSYAQNMVRRNAWIDAITELVSYSEYGPVTVFVQDPDSGETHEFSVSLECEIYVREAK